MDISGEVVTDEDLVVGIVEGRADESALVEGNGNSSGGGMGRMLVAPSWSAGMGTMIEVESSSSWLKGRK